jgi:hypothetical protein
VGLYDLRETVRQVSWEVIHGDCVHVMREMPAASVDSIVTDPPYNLGFFGMKWDRFASGQHFQEWCQGWAEEALRLLKPGGYLLAFGGTRTCHRLTCGIEDAGFDIRDSIAWLSYTGFPKSQDIARAIDKRLGVEGGYGEPKSPRHALMIDNETTGNGRGEAWDRPWKDDPELVDQHAREYLPGSWQAQMWKGWATALKPVFESIVVARKPIEGTLVENVLTHGVGGLNIAATRTPVGDQPKPRFPVGDYSTDTTVGAIRKEERVADSDPSGRWPANVVVDEGVRADLGAAFVYCAKPDTSERNAGLSEPNQHPTLKPVSLMRWLCRLVTPRRTAHCPSCRIEWVNANSSNGDGAVSDVRQTLYGGAAEEPEPAQGFLQPDLFGSMAEQDGTSALEDDEGLHQPLHAGAPVRIETGASDGAQGGDGTASRDAVNAERSGPSQERDQGRQPDRESRRHAEAKARPPAEEAAASGRVPPLPRQDRTQITEARCPQCGGVATERLGRVLDPFAGSGTTGCAAVLEDFSFMGIEKDADYVELTRSRIEHWANQPVQIGFFD